jgi:acetyltransferase-like isoleucine patch superfamily enzyme
MKLSSIKRVIKQPHVLIDYCSSRGGQLLGKHQFDSDCTVEPLVRLQNPDSISIGDGTFIKNHSVVKAKQPDGITFGKNCSINEFCFLSGNISIGDGVRVANQVSMHSFNHKMDRDEMIHKQKLNMGSIVIANDVWIGAGARILKDVLIGKGAVVGAGAVVNSDVPPYKIVWCSSRDSWGKRLSNDGRIPATLI